MRTILTLAALASTLAAQERHAPLAQPLASVFDSVVPVHTAQADPIGGEYGVWAAGPGYKVSFHDGFRFYPVLGAAAPKNLPFGWRTTSITCDGRPLLDASTAPQRAHSRVRYEYRWPGVVEAYDVRKDDVEQTFIIESRPRAIGDIVVTGAIETELRAPSTSNVSGDLAFVDAGGIERVHYGEAWAIDATGRRTPVTRGFDGKSLRLTVPGAWRLGSSCRIACGRRRVGGSERHGSRPVDHPSRAQRRLQGRPCGGAFA